MPSLIPDIATFEKRLAGLPVVKHQAGETVLTAGSKTGRLLFLRTGAVEVLKDGVQIANVSARGSVFGEQAVLLDQAHTADVRTLEQSEFYVADAPTMLAGDPTVALYVAAILARRLDAANRSLIEVKRQLQAGETPSVISRTVEKVEELLSYTGDASLMYAGGIPSTHSHPINQRTEAHLPDRFGQGLLPDRPIDLLLTGFCLRHDLQQRGRPDRNRPCKRAVVCED